MKQEEIERSFLVKKLPSDLHNYQPVTIDTGDFYNPNKASQVGVDHLTVRRKNNRYEIRKKEGVSD